MKFTESQIPLSGAAKICAEGELGDKGYTTPVAILSTNISALSPSSSTLEISGPVGIDYLLGEKREIYVTPTVECTITFGENVKIPSDSFFTSRVIPSGSTCIFMIKWTGSFWMATTVVGNCA